MTNFIIQYIEIAFVFLALGIAGMLWVLIMMDDVLLYVRKD